MQRITLYEFKMLPDQEQHVLVHTEGTFLEVIQKDSSRFVLFGLDKFYVELVYDVPSNSIKSLKTFKRGEELDKYLDLYNL